MRKLVPAIFANLNVPRVMLPIGKAAFERLEKLSAHAVVFHEVDLEILAIFIVIRPLHTLIGNPKTSYLFRGVLHLVIPDVQLTYDLGWNEKVSSLPN